MSIDYESDRFSLDDPNVRRLVTLAARRSVHKFDLPKSVIEDIAQTVLMKLYSLPQNRLEKIRNIPAYLLRAVSNEAANVYRSLEHESKADPIEQFEEFHSASTPDFFEAGILLREIWKHLSDDERKLLQLLIFGYNDKEVGLLLRIGHSSARKRVSRLRKKINLLVG